MYLVRVGYRTVNLEYLIEAADSRLGAPPQVVSPGSVRVSIYPGESFEVAGEDAEHLRLHLDDNLKPLPERKPPLPPEKAHRARAKGGRVRSIASPPKSRSSEE